MSGVEVNAVIDKLADKLAVPAGKLMELLPAIGIKAMFGTVTWLLVLLVGGLLFAIALKIGDGDPINAMGSIGLIALGVGFGGTVIMGAETLLWLYNPQAWALDYILHMIR